MKKFFSIFGMVITMGLCCTLTANAIELGKTYDKSNVDEISEYLIEPILTFVKEGDYIIKTGELDFEPKLSDKFMEESKKNEGKYDIDQESYKILDKETGEPTEDYIVGFPFPNIEKDDPNAGIKIAENKNAVVYFIEGYQGTGQTRWIGRKGYERRISWIKSKLPYVMRESGPIDNPQDLEMQYRLLVTKPSDLDGVVSMTWRYEDPDESDDSWSYVPTVRRPRRVSAAGRSDPFMGSDFCLDDTDGWDGKNASMNWSLEGDDEILVPFPMKKEYLAETNSDESISLMQTSANKGITCAYHEEDSDLAPWCPTSTVWTLRPVWEVKLSPKDEYYAYGDMYLYVDKETNAIYFKKVMDNKGNMWKIVTGFYMHFKTVDQDFRHYVTFGYHAVDLKADHGSFAPYWDDAERSGDYSIRCYDKSLDWEDFSVGGLRQLGR